MTRRDWSVLGVAALAMVATLPGRTQGLGLVTEPLLADLKLDRVSYATLNLWATLIGSALCLPCGRFIDRYGARAVQTVVAAALGLAVIAMSRAEGWVALAFTVTLVRGLGQSALSVASLALMGKRFPGQLGKPMALYSLLVAMGFIAAFPAVGQQVLSSGWRAAWLAIGVVVAVAVAPLSWLMIGRLAPARTAASDATASAGFRDDDFTLAQALGSAAFWILALGSALFGLVYSGIALFNESILVQRGFDARVYHTVLVVSTMVGLAANFAAGWLAMRFPLPKIAAAGLAVLAVAVGMLPYVSSYRHVMIYAATMGVAGGVVTVVFFSVWGELFGRTHLGRIQGAAQLMTVVASAVGPVLLAKTQQQAGSYEPVFLLLAALTAALGAASWVIRQPRAGVAA